MNKSTISVITINYNNASGLKKTIDSIGTQKCKDFEFVIVDGGSQDGSVELIKNCDFCDLFISEKDKGIYDAMNKGINISSGDYLIFINSGDVLMEDGISNLKTALLDTNSFFDIYHGILAFESDGVITHYRGRVKSYLPKGMIEHPTVLMRRDTIKELNGFDLSWRFVADYELLLRAYKKHKSFYFIEKVLSAFDTSGVSSTNYKSPIESLKLRYKYKCISTIEYFSQLILLEMKRCARCVIKLG